jgi:hypothetical protein
MGSTTNINDTVIPEKKKKNESDSVWKVASKPPYIFWQFVIHACITNCIDL